MTEQVGQSPQEIIVGEGVSLKPVTVEDSDAMFAIIDANREYFSQFHDDTATKYPTLESMRKRNSQQSESERRFCVWDEKQIIGFVKVTGRKEKGWEIGYWMGPQFKGRGYMTMAAETLTDWTFSHLRAQRVFATVDTRNIASARVLQKIGYQLEGPNPTDPRDVIYARTRPQTS